MFTAQHKKGKNINLLPQEEFAASSWGRTLKWLLTTFRYLVISTEMIVIAAFLSRFWFDSVNADLNDDIKQKEDYIRAYSSFELEFRRVQDKINIFTISTSQSGVSTKIVQAIVDNLPKDIKLLRVDMNEDDILTIAGSSLSERSIEQLIVNLNNDETFSEVNLTQVESKANTPFLNFTVQAKLERAK